MNIILEARALLHASGGVRSYVANLVDNCRNSTNLNLDILDGSTNSSVPLHSEMLVPWWLTFQVAPYIKKQKPDVVHFTKADIPFTKTVPTVVTIYDVIPLLLPETQSSLRRLYWPIALRHSALHADRIITISEQSKKDIVRLLDVSPEKIRVTPLAVDTDHFSPFAKATGDKATNNPYILFVGTWDARKNITSLIKAYEKIADSIPHNLIIAGRPAKKDDGSRSYAEKSQYSNRIVFKESVPYDDLPLLYSGADMFVWPSVYEGWGFPVQEAMACGTPVITSNGGSLPEVVGTAGIVVPFQSKNLHTRMYDQDFINCLADEMIALAHDQHKKNELQANGLKYVHATNWKDVANQTVEVYKELIL